jgi:hypothetical protein
MKTSSRHLLAVTIAALLGNASCFDELRLAEFDAGVEGADGPASTGDGRASSDHAALEDMQSVGAADGPMVDGPSGADTMGPGSDARSPEACTEGTIRCGADRTPETCSASGDWKPGTRCPFVCSGAGACTGECQPDTKRCAGAQKLTPETCDSTGKWVAQAPCANLCSSGSCGGSCMPGTKQCGANQTPETCSPQGTWEPGPPCPAVCEGNGACGGECRPESKSCADLVPRTCDSTGHWQAGTACRFACSAGNCGGSCKPGSRRCSANQMAVETCGSDAATWSQSSLCDVGCDMASGACTTCGGGIPDKCTGKCTNLQNDTKNCGTCGHDCTALAHVASAGSVSCNAGHCVIPASACVAGYGHCGGDPPDNGCETNIAAPATCGCGSSCVAGQSCTQNGPRYECHCPPGSPDTPDCKKPIGQTCAKGAECGTGFCTNGYCCNQACSDNCYSCAGAQTGQGNGTCAPVTTNAVCSPKTCKNGNVVEGHCSAGSCQLQTAQLCKSNEQCHGSTCMAVCGDEGQICCPSLKCNASTLFCDDNAACKQKLPDLAECQDRFAENRDDWCKSNYCGRGGHCIPCGGLKENCCTSGKSACSGRTFCNNGCANDKLDPNDKDSLCEPTPSEPTLCPL